MERYAFIMLGYPGSGKSFVAEWIADRFHAVHLRTDDLRVRMFEGDRPELHQWENQNLVNNAYRYAYEQIMKSGQASVVLDANHNRREHRAELGDVAKKYRALPITVWIKTPEDIAQQRIASRAASGGHVIFKADTIIEKMKRNMRPPDNRENVITIDGLLEAGAQQASFDKQLAELRQSTLQ